MINCGSVTLHSTQTEKITLEHHRMQVIEKETFEETKVTIHETSFIRNSSPVKIISKSPWMLIFLNSYKWVDRNRSGYRYSSRYSNRLLNLSDYLVQKFGKLPVFEPVFEPVSIPASGTLPVFEPVFEPVVF